MNKEIEVIEFCWAKLEALTYDAQRRAIDWLRVKIEDDRGEYIKAQGMDSPTDKN